MYICEQFGDVLKQIVLLMKFSQDAQNMSQIDWSLDRTSKAKMSWVVLCLLSPPKDQGEED